MKGTPRSLLGLACLLLAGCAATPPRITEPPPPPSKVARDSTLKAIQSFESSGVLAIRTSRDASSLHWQWQQQGSQYFLTLRGPVSFGTVWLKGTPTGVVLVMPDGRTVKAARADQLLLKETGWKLPVSGLYYWIRGLPDPQTPSGKTFDARHRLVLLKQSGWTIRYPEYQSANGIDLPAKITLSTRDINVKIVIRKWRIH